MGYDAFTPVSAARINATVLPAGRIKVSVFDTFLTKLQEHRIVCLDSPGNDAEHDSKFRAGNVVYDFSSSQDDRHLLDAFPFDLNRLPQAIFAVADGKEIFGQDGEDINDNADLAYQTLIYDFERHQNFSRNTAARFLLIFDGPSHITTTREDIFIISTSKVASDSVKTVVAALTQTLLTQMAALIRELETHPIDSPRLALRPSQGTLGLEPRPGSSTSISRATSPKPSSAVMANPTTSSENQTSSSKARYQIVLGAFHLQAGRWLDALKELADGATVARSSNDYIWHGKALEYLVVCMLMLGWAGRSFAIPQVCRSAVENGLLSRPLQGTPAAITPPLAGGSTIPHEESPATVQDLCQLIPNLVSTIVTLYTRASSFTQEKLPQTMMCEARIRLANLLIFLYMENPSMNTSAISSLVLGTKPEPSQTKMITTIQRTRKSYITGLLIGAVTDSQNELSNNDFVHVLVGVVSGLSRLRLDRKQAFHLKELLQNLVPCLVEARKIGAAEMGIHPAAGLSILNGGTLEDLPNLRQGTPNLLDMVGRLYGMPSLVDVDLTTAHQSDLELIKRRLIEWTLGQSSGDVLLKMEILRLCISVGEALPDLAACLRFTIQLLQIARRTITLSNQSDNESPAMSAEEQVRLINNIKRTVNAAPKIGLIDLRAEYWDDFLVRGIQLLDSEGTTKLVPHTSQDLALAVGDISNGKKDLFIYNPFLNNKATADTMSVLVAGEIAQFAVNLQNLFEFDVEIDHISLLTEGCAFEAQSHTIVLGHCCNEKFILSGVPRTSGTLKVLGCQVRIRNCYERSFYIFDKEWQPPKITKFKRVGPRTQASADRAQAPETTSQSIDLDGFLQTHVVSLAVVQPQPDIALARSSLAQSSLMLLEGEKKEFQITLENRSKTASANLLLFTFEDSVTTQLRAALENRELSPIELYEVQHQLGRNPSIRWKNFAQGEEQQLPAGSSQTFTFEAFGNPGLTSATVQINYAHLAMPMSEIKDKFYTRQISFVVALTVNANVDIPRFNLLPLSDNFVWPQQHIRLSNGTSTELREESLVHGQAEGVPNCFNAPLSSPELHRLGAAFCLIVIDFRNVWPHPVLVSLTTGDYAQNEAAITSQAMRRTASEILQPGHVSRIVVAMPRILIPFPYAPVPTIGSQRQFVLSASKLSMEAEAAAREAFWYQEELLKHISGVWKEAGTGREGIIDFRRAVRLSSRMIETVRVDHVEIDFLVKYAQNGSSNNNNQNNCVQQLSKSRFIVHTGIFATLTVRVRNRTDERLRLLLRLQPSIRNQPHNLAMELSKRFAWSGVLQRGLHPALDPGEIREAELGITALAEGEFEIGATVEETQGRRSKANANDLSGSGASTERRIWHAREPCLIDAVEVKRADE